MSDSGKYEFRKRELALILVLFLMSGAILFYLGIKIGELLLHKNTLVAEEIIKNANTPVDKCQQPQAAKPEETCKEPIEITVATKTPPSEMKDRYTVQIDAYQNKDDAEKRALELYDDGYKLAYYKKVEIPGQGTWFRVCIGFFKQQLDAEKFGEALKKQNVTSSYIVRKED
jgi:cell division septation protein DedD